MEIITREGARAIGLKRFFTGEPCKNGHISERFVSSAGCCLCSASRVASSRKSNPDVWRKYRSDSYSADKERHRSYVRIYSEANREKIRSAQRRKYRENPEKFRDKSRRFRESNPGVAAMMAKEYRRKNPAKSKESAKRWRGQNKEKILAYNLKRRSARIQRTPIWFGEFDLFVWQEAAHLAIVRESATAIEWHADHMIPISARKASGLHVWNNCQVIPAQLNMEKKNKMTMTEYGEWLRRL